MAEWSNWSGNVRAHPVRVEAPATEAEVQELVVARNCRRTRSASRRLAPLVHAAVRNRRRRGRLHALTGIESIDRDAGTATVLAGTLISAIGDELRAAGLALHNQGDVDVQTVTRRDRYRNARHRALVAAISRQWSSRCASSAPTARSCGPTRSVRPGLFQAGRLSLGALGIVTAVTFQCVPAYNLHERVWFEGPEQSLELLTARVEATRHYEFWWYPFRDLFEHKALALTNAPPDPLPDRKREQIGFSHRVFPSVREHRFNEMEYAVPAECGPACFAEIRALMHRKHPDVQWPVEYRTLAGDDVWLSPAYGRDTVTISVHEDAAHDPARCSAIAKTCSAPSTAARTGASCTHGAAADLAPAYERWDHFWRLRAELDPDGRFLNDHLRRVGGVPTAT